MVLLCCNSLVAEHVTHKKHSLYFQLCRVSFTLNFDVAKLDVIGRPQQNMII